MPRPIDQLPPDATSLARRVQSLERAVTELRASRRLAHSSLTGTAITVYDTDGVTPRGAIGLQPDGTLGLVAEGGPAPSAPTQPLVTPSIGGLRVVWDGTLADGSTLPADFDHVAVHVSTVPGDIPSPATFAGTITRSGDGGMLPVTPLPYQQHYVVLVAVNTSGNSSAPSTEAAATPLQVDGVDLSRGSVTLDTLSGPAFDLAAQRYVDAMSDPTAWTVLSSATGAAWDFLTGVTDAPTGQSVAQATGYTVARGTVQVPYDPDTLYRISARVRTTAASSSGTDTLYVGLLGVAADGVTLVNRTGANTFSSQHYVAASNQSQPNGSGWTVYTGYVKGRAATGGTGTGGTAPDPKAPGVVHADVRFISPLLFLNNASGPTGANSSTGTMQVDAVSIEALKTGTVDAINLVVNAVTAAAIKAGAVTADKLEAVLQLVTRLVAGDPAGARVELNADGLRVYNSSGALTIRFDSADGSAVFTGSITGSTMTGSTITGGTMQTAASGNRVVMTTGTGGGGQQIGVLSYYTEVATDAPGSVIAKGPADGAQRALVLTAPKATGTGAPASAPSVALSYGESPGSTRADVTADDVWMPGAAHIGGILSAGNIAWGTVTITPTAANTPTSVAVTGLVLHGSSFYAQATASTSLPGTEVTGVGVTNVTSGGLTIWLTRTNTTATNVNWMVIGS